MDLWCPMEDDELDLAEVYEQGVLTQEREYYHRPISASGSIEQFQKAVGNVWYFDPKDGANCWEKERKRIAQLEADWQEELQRREVSA